MGVSLYSVLFYLLFVVAPWSVIIYVTVLLIKALRKYLRSSDARKEKSAVKKSLGEVLKENRTKCQMTQEFVAESIGVSRQAVSKWESGVSEPSTTNLLALSKLFGLSAGELIDSIQSKGGDN